MAFPNAERVKEALAGRNREVLRVVVMQPLKSSANPPEPGVLIRVPGR